MLNLALSRGPRQRGFTLVELLIAMVILSVILAFTVPAVFNLIVRSRTEGYVRSVGVLFSKARHEAVKTGTQTVVAIDPANDELIAFVDVHGADPDNDPPDGLFNPAAGRAHRTTDFVIGRQPLPSLVSFAAPAGEDLIDGFSAVPGEANARALFQRNGSISDAGGFRFGDERGNFLEVRVAPAATARIDLRMWDEDASAWHAAGEGGSPWKWK